MYITLGTIHGQEIARTPGPLGAWAAFCVDTTPGLANRTRNDLVKLMIFYSTRAGGRVQEITDRYFSGEEDLMGRNPLFAIMEDLAEVIRDVAVWEKLREIGLRERKQELGLG